MTTTFHALTALPQPRLHLWRDPAKGGTARLAYDVDSTGPDADGLQRFSSQLDHQIHEPVQALLHGTVEGKSCWENALHRKPLPRLAQYRFPGDVWCVEGAGRVLAANPFQAAHDRVRIHLITARKYRDGRLRVGSPGQPPRWIEATGCDATGPYFDVALGGHDRHLFLFKFAQADGTLEPDSASRLWSAHDGPEIWVHSQASAISVRRPALKPLVVHCLRFGSTVAPRLHLWQEDSDFVADVDGVPEERGWVRFEHPVYTERPYRFMFFESGPTPSWEDDEAQRTVFLKGEATWMLKGDGGLRRLGSTGVWTLEGDHALFGREPSANKEVVLEVSGRAPEGGLTDPLTVEVWINRARGKMHRALAPGANGRWTFRTYPNVVTSVRFRSASRAEAIDRHYLKISETESGPTHCFAVVGRADLLPSRPATDLFRDPPFVIERPGAWMADGQVRFALHCPTASAVELVGEWTGWQDHPVAMRSTRDGAYWWAQVPVAAIAGALARESVHGVLYKFLLNQVRLVQDPAADWVENSDPEKASRLVDHGQFPWSSNDWIRPGWDSLTIYQLHPARFAQRAGTSGLDGVTREIAAPDGYLRQIKATALLLMPTCEFSGDLGWGYNPSFFYSVESYYGGPDALKRLVDACHRQGYAVLLDVVFNHASTSDNVLWSVARGSFFDGDTDWGAMINFDHPQVIHFFERNLVHFLQHYRVDGFRFDFTRVIHEGGGWGAHVRQPGSGGGWEFLQRLRAAVHGVDPGALLMAEELPNCWALTHAGGPMDTQWCDAFHDRLLDAARGYDVMGPLAEALQLSSTACQRWFESTHYPESHDEVGNEPHRISAVAGPGQGFRRNKVAAAATLLSRGIPLWFMGAESGEWRQFAKDGCDTLDLDHYESDDSARRIRQWWNRLCELRRGNNRIVGPAPLAVHFAQNRLLAFSRGEAADLFVVLNFGDWSGPRSLAELNLPDGEYKELLNSTWGDFRLASENEDEHPNGGWDAHLHRSAALNIPDYGVVILEKR